MARIFRTELMLDLGLVDLPRRLSKAEESMLLLLSKIARPLLSAERLLTRDMRQKVSDQAWKR
jgi:hypothetical protein